MTRKDFEILAKALRDSRPPVWDHSGAVQAQWRRSREQIALACASSNPRFNTNRFYSATEQ